MTAVGSSAQAARGITRKMPESYPTDRGRCLVAASGCQVIVGSAGVTHKIHRTGSYKLTARCLSLG
jgi:hypothetical protein